MSEFGVVNDQDKSQGQGTKLHVRLYCGGIK